MAYRAVILADSPLLYWRLGEATGPTAADETGNARTGTYNGSPTLGVAGLLADDPTTCATLIVANSSRIASSFNPFVAASTRTFEAWVKRASTAALHTIFGGTVAASPRLGCVSGSTSVQFRPQANSATGAVTWGSALTSGAAHHVVLIYNDSTHNAELYVDGVSQGVLSTTGLSYNATPGNFQSGCIATTTTPFDGQMEEVAIYSGALTPTQILAHYNEGKSMHGASAAAVSVAFASAAVPESPASASAASSEDLSAAAIPDSPASVSWPESADLSASAIPESPGAATPAASADLSAGAAAESAVGADAVATGDLSAGGLAESPAAAAVSAGTDLSADAAAELLAAGLLDGSLDLSAIAESEVVAAALLDAAVALDAAPTIDASGVLVSAALAIEVTLTAVWGRAIESVLEVQALPARQAIADALPATRVAIRTLAAARAAAQARVVAEVDAQTREAVKGEPMPTGGAFD